MVYKFTVDKSIAVKDFLAEKGFSSRVISRLKSRFGLIKVNAVAVNVAYCLCKADHLEIEVAEKGKMLSPQTKDFLKVLYNDEYFSIVSKPPNVESVEGRSSIGYSLLSMYQNTMSNINNGCNANTCKEECDNINSSSKASGLSSSKKYCVPRVVTRLDKDTSGVAIIAKSAYIHNLLSKLIVQNKIEKTYLALVYGNVKGCGIIDKNIAREDGLYNGKPSIKRAVCESMRGKTAITEYEVVSCFSKYTLLSVSPKTGRTHQIRVHLDSIGHSIVGDNLYKSSLQNAVVGCCHSLNRQALHAYSYSFNHPVTNEAIKVVDELSGDILEFIQKIKNGSNCIN